MFTNISGVVTKLQLTHIKHIQISIVVGCSAVFHSKKNPEHTVNRWQKAATKQRLFKNSKINSFTGSLSVQTSATNMCKIGFHEETNGSFIMEKKQANNT